MGGSIAVGAVVSGGLVALGPAARRHPPCCSRCCAGRRSTSSTCSPSCVLMKEPRTHVDATGVRRAADSAREAPGVIRDGLGLLRHNRVLRCAGAGRGLLDRGARRLRDLPADPARRAGRRRGAGRRPDGTGRGRRLGRLRGRFGPGRARAAGGFGVARTAILARILNGLGAVTMGLVAGPVALIAAYLFTYALHGTGGPMHDALLHREASARNRATVLSMGSMVFFIVVLALRHAARPARRGHQPPGVDGHRGRLQPARRVPLPARAAGRAGAGSASAGGRRRSRRPRTPRRARARSCGRGRTPSPHSSAKSRAEDEHRRHQEAEADRGDLHDPAGDVRPLGAEHAGEHAGRPRRGRGRRRARCRAARRSA